MTAASRYRIGRLIKRGGMAEVYEGSLIGEGGFQRRVAIKRLLPGYDPEDAAALADEARIASQLHHAGIVGVLDFGTLDGVPFIVTELVDGVDLAGMWSLADQHASPVPVEVGLRIAVEVGHALAHAHKARDGEGALLGIVHRDVSPENVLISWSGDVKLTDFGIARGSGRRAETKVGETKGKLGFMAPEQLRGNDVDARTDVFGLGCLLHFAIARASPLEIEPALAAGELTVAIEPSVPEDIRAIIERATAIDVRRRYQSAGEMAEASATALFARVRADPRSITSAWLSPLKPRDTVPPVRKAKAGDLLELVFDQGRESGARRFTSIVARAETELIADDVQTVRAPAPAPAQPITVTVPSIVATDPAITKPPTLDTTARVPVVLEREPRRIAWWPFAVAAVLAIPAGVMLALASVRREENRSDIVQPIVEPPKPPVEERPPPQPEPVIEAAEPPETPQDKPQKRAKLDPRDEADLRATLAARGLELADLAAIPETQSHYIEWKTAKKSADRRAFTKTTADLKAATETAPIPLALLKTKLQRLNLALDTAAAEHGAKPLEALYAEYLELRSAARSGASPEECEKILARAHALSARIERKAW